MKSVPLTVFNVEILSNKQAFLMLTRKTNILTKSHFHVNNVVDRLNNLAIVKNIVSAIQKEQFRNCLLSKRTTLAIIVVRYSNIGRFFRDTQEFTLEKNPTAAKNAAGSSEA